MITAQKFNVTKASQLHLRYNMGVFQIAYVCTEHVIFWEQKYAKPKYAKNAASKN